MGSSELIQFTLAAIEKGILKLDTKEYNTRDEINSANEFNSQQIYKFMQTVNPDEEL